MSPAAAIGLALALPLLAAVLIVAAGRRPNLREAVSVAAGLGTVALLGSLAPAVADGARPGLVLAEPLPGVAVALAAEPLGMLFALVAGGLWVVTAVYAVGYMRAHHEAHQTRFFAFFALSIGAALGVALAANLFTLFLFYELLTVATYPLVTHAGTERARAAGRTYLGILLTTSIGLQLPAMVGVWLLAGTLEFRPGGILAGTAPDWVLGTLLGLFVLGIGKAAVMPMHRWLPAAMVAPTPVSALLHAVAVVKAGVFAILKVVVLVFGVDTVARLAAADWLLALAAFTVVAASLVALRQDDLKRRLAYSTVSQLGYVVMAALVLAPVSLVGAGLHIAAHAFGKITLFFAAGAILVAAHKTRVSELDGIGWRMPWTLGAFAMASLSLVGIPPTVGFLSKWFMLLGAWTAGEMAVLVVLTLSTLLNAAYFLPIVHAAFFRRLPAAPDGHGHGEAPALVVAPLVLTAGATLVLFLFPELPLGLARAFAEAQS